MSITEDRTQADLHPLAPLTAAEIETTTAILRGDGLITQRVRVVSIALREPPKDLVQRFPDVACARETEIVVREPDQRATYEGVVDLGEGRVVSWEHVPGAQPRITATEFDACGEAVMADPRWQAAMHRRGVTDFSLTTVDAWAVGYTPDRPDLRDPELVGRRLATALTCVRPAPDDNPYARPVEGLRARVDLDSLEVIDVEDGVATPLPPKAGSYYPERMSRPENYPRVEQQRPDVKPIQITQPEGPSFTVDGYHVTWQKWDFRVGFSAREGLVLHQLGYRDRGRLRPIIHRAGLAEIFTPYSDTGMIHRAKGVFDAGEYGAGFVVNSLKLGCDCLGEIYYFDVVVNDDEGGAVTLPNAICLHEEDTGIAWKHTDFRAGPVETRRNRRLVISIFAVVGNYQYGYFWYLYMDGTIGFEIKLTGMISTGAFSEDAPPEFGTIVAPGLYGPNHQHFFNMRLDMCLDGNDNSVFEMNSELVDEQELELDAWKVTPTPITRESDAQRVCSAATGRFWLITNPSVTNGIGQPVGYKLVPGNAVLPLQREGSRTWRRAQFAFKHLWVTRYHRDELYAAGTYPNQHEGGEGLPRYVQADRSLENTDVVLWHTFGDHHVVRPEDWPVMPVMQSGFQLRPFGFFDGNPALDIPESVEGPCHTGNGHPGNGNGTAAGPA